MNGLVPLDGFYHYGMVVQDFDRALDELSVNLGLEWASVQQRTFDVRQPNGLVLADFRVTYSVTGPPYFEVIQQTPGTIWAYAGGGVHHLGYWSDDLEADSRRLADAGYLSEGTYHNPDVDGPFGFTYHMFPATRLRVELVDSARKPAFKNWLAGGDFPSARDDEAMG